MPRPDRIAADPAAGGAAVSRRDLGRGTLAVALGALLGSATIQSSPAVARPVPAAPGDPGEPTLRLDSVSPAAITATTSVRTAVTVTAPEQAPFPGGELRLAVNRSRFTSRGGLQDWESRTPDRGLGTRIAAEPVPALAAGASASIVVTFSASELRLAGRSWGPRGVSLSLHALDPDAPAPEPPEPDAAEELPAPEPALLLEDPSAVLRTFLVWAPDGAPERPLAWSVLLPLVAMDPAAPDPTLTAETLHEAAASPRLTAQGAIAARPEVDWLLDPALLDVRTPPPGAEEATAPPVIGAQDPNGEAAEAHVEASVRGELVPLSRDLAANAGGRTVWMLPYGRAHLPSLAEAPSLEGTLAAETRRVTETAGIVPAGRAVLPDPAALSTALPAAFAGAADVAVLPEPSVPLVSGTHTPSGAAPLPVGAGDEQIVGLLPDQRLSRHLVRACAPATAGAGLQRLLAETAMIQLEAPNLARQVLLSPDAAWTPDAAAAGRALDALASAGWLEVSRTAGLLGAADGSLRGELQPVAPAEDGSGFAPLDAPEAPHELPEEPLGVLEDRASRLDALTVAVASDVVLRSARQSLLLATSSSFAAEPGLAPRAASTAAVATDPVLGAVRFPDSSQINLVAGNGAVPLTIVNDLPVAVTVVPELDPEHPIVRFGTEDESGTPSFGAVTIGPLSSQSIDVPVQAVTNGTVAVDMTLRNRQGELITSPVQLSMTVNADWEDAATGVFGGAMAALLVVGIVRARRRKNREGVPTRAPAEIGPDSGTTDDETTGDETTSNEETTRDER